ncbi:MULTISPECIES: hypothetical protein [Neisseria]|uniref:Lipoprotein n=1 Tax=Neisseria lactamica TaxID=486 RepID=A0A378VM16_NEILA|nr:MULTISPECIES: hypothetical protein [Neisseria]SUA16103.1 lipoprotein [Neisseria lactamica]SUA18037.1 lipoprotein [Neisseria lactamica]
MKTLILICTLSALAACATPSEQGGSRVYGEIKAGIETRYSR